MSDTREAILTAALALFSRRGFSAVSIRDICREVGIKESTVYYHFENKQAIFDTLLERFSSLAAELTARLDQALAQGGAPEAPGGAAYRAFLEGWFLDGFCNQVMRLLQIEQAGGGAARELYETWLFDAPLDLQSRVFARLFPGADGRALAVRHYAPILFFAQRWLLGGPWTEARRDAFRADVGRHLRAFYAELEVG